MTTLTPTTRAELLPCPFCDKIPEIVEWPCANSPRLIAQVRCDCGVDGPQRAADNRLGHLDAENGLHRNEAIAAWNTRGGTPTTRAEDDLVQLAISTEGYGLIYILPIENADSAVAVPARDKDMGWRKANPEVYENLVKRFNEYSSLHEALAAERALRVAAEARVREAAMQSLADLGQAQEALDRAVAAEGALARGIRLGFQRALGILWETNGKDGVRDLEFCSDVAFAIRTVADDPTLKPLTRADFIAALEQKEKS